MRPPLFSPLARLRYRYDPEPEPDAIVGPRPRGSRRPHTDGRVAHVRRLIDGYLGDANSAERQAASHLLNRIAKRMRNASAHQSTDQWEALFGSDND